MSYDDAVVIPNSPTFTRGVKPKWEGSPPTLWLGVPIHLTRYDPPGGQATQSVMVRGESRDVLRWSDSEWDDFVRSYIALLNEFWHHRFVLTPAGATARGLPAEMPRAIICGYKAWAEPNEARATMKPIVFKPASIHQGSACGFFGRRISAGLPEGAPAFVTAVLDRRDLEYRVRSASVREGSNPPQARTFRQRAATHESGHHLGLMHRCTSVRVRDVPTYRPLDVATYQGDSDLLQGAYVHGSAAADGWKGNAYCADSENETGIDDLMGYGESCHPWHAAPWLQILLSSARRSYGTRGLRTCSQVGWTAQVAQTQ